MECEEQQKKKLAEKEKRTKELAEKRAQRGKRVGCGRGQRRHVVRKWSFVSDGHLQALVMYLAVHREEASDPLSHRGSCRQGVQQQTNSHVTQDVESSTSSDSSRSYCCPICGLPTRVLWVACDSCDRWFHAECTDINPDNFSNLHNVDWVCMAVFNLYRPFMSP